MLFCIPPFRSRWLFFALFLQYHLLVCYNSIQIMRPQTVRKFLDTDSERSRSEAIPMLAINRVPTQKDFNNVAAVVGSMFTLEVTPIVESRMLI